MLSFNQNNTDPCLRMSNKQASKPKAPMVDVSTSVSFPYDTSNDENAPNSNIDCAGRHFIVDFWGAQNLDNTQLIEQALLEAARVAGAVLLHVHLHKFSQGGGVTGVALLAESHISVHTWPELDYAAFDVFMCGNAKPEKAVACLEEYFAPTKHEVKEILRGEQRL